ncbi:MAG TPA: hypothetical protein VF845_09610 [Terriglobales bacterium]
MSNDSMSDESILRKLEFCPLSSEVEPLECSFCKSADAEFEIGVWYDDDDPEKDMPTSDGLICGPCLVTWVAQETSRDMAFVKRGNVIEQYADEG